VRSYLAVHPDSADGHFLLGLILFKQGKPAESLSEYTEGAKRHDPGAADLKIVAISPDEETQRILGMDEASPLLKIERLTHNEQNEPVDFEYLYVRTDYLHYSLRVERRAAT